MTESLALAAVETLTTLPSYQALETYVYVRVDLPSEAKITKLSPDALPDGWDQRPSSSASQREEQAWIDAGDTIACAVPSVVIPHSWKMLLNPRHPAMDDLQIREAEVFPVDERLRGA